MRESVTFDKTHTINQRQQNLHRLRKGESYVYHRGLWSRGVDSQLKATVNHLMNVGDITSVQRSIGADEYDFIAQGLVED
jgi:hypothetical protein